MLNFRIARQYAIPYMDRVTMPEKWANWLAKRGDGNPRLLAEPAVGGFKTWDHGKHGPAQWMEFFYDWRFADLFNTGTLDLRLTSGAIRQVAYRADGTEAWRYDDPAAGFMDIRMDSNFPVLDIDGDGRIEAILPRKVGSVLHLCIVDATTGALKRSTPFPEMREYPADLRCGILAVNARGRPRPSDILVGWDYHELFLFDETLNLLWRRRLGGRQPGWRRRLQLLRGLELHGHHLGPGSARMSPGVPGRSTNEQSPWQGTPRHGMDGGRTGGAWRRGDPHRVTTGRHTE